MRKITQLFLFSHHIFHATYIEDAKETKATLTIGVKKETKQTKINWRLRNHHQPQLVHKRSERTYMRIYMN